jgi:hypothetical protein
LVCSFFVLAHRQAFRKPDLRHFREISTAAGIAMAGHAAVSDAEPAFCRYDLAMRIQSWSILATVLALGLASSTTPLLAAEQPSDAATLPGVDGKYRIVKPVPPEPEPDDAAPESARYGRWDVTVSGKLTIDVGAGDLPSPKGSHN